MWVVGSPGEYRCFRGVDELSYSDRLEEGCFHALIEAVYQELKACLLEQFAVPKKGTPNW